LASHLREGGRPNHYFPNCRAVSAAPANDAIGETLTL
jgi:hypothetical protein